MIDCFGNEDSLLFAYSVTNNHLILKLLSKSYIWTCSTEFIFQNENFELVAELW